jgi:uncharacterized protein (TIGR00251 family)
MLDLRNKENYLRVKVLPGASNNEIKEIRKDNIEGDDVETVCISIKAPADKNKANFELVKFLAKELLINKDDIKIISGATSRIKLLKISKN